MWLTVRRAVVASVLLGVMLPAVLVGLFISQVISSDKLNSEVTRTLQQSSDVLSLGIRESLWALDAESASALVDAVMKNPALVSVEIVDPQLGRVVFREVAARRIGKLRVLDRPVLYKGDMIGRVRIELSEASFHATLNGQILALVSVLCLQVFSSVALILFVLQRRVGHPLRRLSDEAGSLAQGDLDMVIAPLRNDEIGQVESRLELMRQALQGLFHSLEQKNRALEVDLRERMRVEATLRDREQRLRTLVEQSPLAVIEFDFGWHMLDWNQAAQRIFGWRREEVLGRHASMLMAPDDGASGVAQTFDRSAATGNAKRTNRCSDGRTITCQWYNSIIRDGNGTGQRIVAMVEDISDRQRVDDELRRLATVVRLTTSLVALTDEQGRVEWCNNAFEERCSAPGEEVCGAMLFDCLGVGADSDSDSQLEIARSALANGTAVRDLEVSCRNPRGEPYWVSMELQPIRGSRDGMIQWVVLLADITDKRRFADSLRNLARLGGGDDARVFLEQLLSVVARGAGADAAYVATHGGQYIDVVVAWVGNGWPLKIGRHEAIRSVAASVEHTGSIVIGSGAYEVVRGDAVMGECSHTEALIAEPIRGSADTTIGHVALLFGLALSSTEQAQSLAELGAARAGFEYLRLQALEEKRRSEQRFASIFNYSPIPLMVLRKEDGTCIDMNPAFASVFGYARTEVLGRSLFETPYYLGEKDRASVLDLLRGEAEVAGMVLQIRSRDGEIHDCQLHGRIVSMDMEGLCLLVAVVDVTPLRAAQRQVEELNHTLERRVKERTRDLAETNTELERTLEQLKRTLDELVRSEKLAALGSLVAGITHELNTPIGNSLMVASTLKDFNRSFRTQMETGLRRSVLENYVQESEAAADILMRNLNRAGELITSFKQVAVDQASAKRRDFELAEVINEIVVTMQPLFRRTPYLVETQIPGELRMRSYPGPLGQVVANLLNNAILHAFEGRTTGKVVLSAEAEGDGFIILRCKDDGVGIAKENINRIFEPFFTTKLGRDGTGLGLNIVHSIVTESLAGEISVFSELGGGTEFVMKLPMEAPDPGVDDDLQFAHA